MNDNLTYLQAIEGNGTVKYIDKWHGWDEDYRHAIGFGSEEVEHFFKKLIRDKEKMRGIDRVHYIVNKKVYYTYSTGLRFKMDMRNLKRRKQNILNKINKVLTPAEMKCIKVEIPYEPDRTRPASFASSF